MTAGALIDACVVKREHMPERDFLTQLHATHNAPSHPIRNRLLRLTAESPDLLVVIKTEGKVWTRLSAINRNRIRK